MFKHMPFSKALGPGANLWILPFSPDEFLFKKINWHLGFIIQSLSSQTPLKKPLLLSTEHFFTNKQIVCLPDEKEEHWITLCYHQWKKFNRTSLRIFLPKNIEFEDLENHWPSKTAYNNLSYAFLSDRRVIHVTK